MMRARVGLQVSRGCLYLGLLGASALTHRRSGRQRTVPLQAATVTIMLASSGYYAAAAKQG